ncbi:hypothetical protein T11_3187 [Trichinella zimbabwensis]|uniref:Uncharacterized protein n=1 Tax=Trichinella zimbabwensis TaxID=268475 RepID=A0A0V1I1C6_9BILA|nr:hypothetical protein T11_3187 [Trichinella zimbabwensis]
MIRKGQFSLARPVEQNGQASGHGSPDELGCRENTSPMLRLSLSDVHYSLLSYEILSIPDQDACQYFNSAQLDCWIIDE